MSRILEATCDASGKVTADGAVVDGAFVFSEGKQASSGLLFLQGDNAFFIPSSATDIKTVIEKLVLVIDDLNASLNQLVTTLTSVGAGMTGPTTAPPPTLASDLAQITAKVTSLTSTKSALNTLKGALK